jgi:predicted phosphate transport protein (TIGR00153 family)
MAWLSSLFARSPFGPIKEHQHKVQECAELTSPIIEACLRGDHDQVRQLARQISALEQESDTIKNRVRDGLPKSLFMPVSRSDLLNVLSVQDSIADVAEDLGVLLTFREMEPLPKVVAELLRDHVRASLEVVHQSTEVVEQLDKLVQASFAGPEAQRVLGMIDLLDQKEHEADKVQDQLAKAFFANEDSFKPAAIFLWMKIFNKVGDLANYAEKMGHRVRLFMAQGS